MSDLVDELRDLHRDYVAGRWHQYDRVKDILAIAADALEAKDKEIERLRRENAELWCENNEKCGSLSEHGAETIERLREALQEILDLYDPYGDDYSKMMADRAERALSKDGKALKEQA